MVTTEPQEKHTVMPACCKGCGKVYSRPPAYLRVLNALSPGTGQKMVGYTKAAIAGAAGMTKQQAGPVVDQALEAGLLEPAPGVAGSRVYRKTHYGSLVLSRWRKAGWTPKTSRRPK